jgi:predicted transcriptional regulator
MDKTIKKICEIASETASEAVKPYAKFPTYLAYDLTFDKQKLDVLAMYVYLLTYKNRESGTAYPTMKTICRDLNIGENKARRLIKLLVEQGYIKKSRLKTKGNKFANCVYTFPDTPEKFFGEPPHRPYEYHEKAYKKIRKDGLMSSYGFIGSAFMRDPKISIRAKGLMIYLQSFAGTKGEAHPSVRKICFHCNICEETYRTYRRELEKNGYLERKQLHTAGRFSTNIFKLTSSHVVRENEKLDAFNSSLSRIFVLSQSPKKSSMENGNTVNSNMVNERTSNTLVSTTNFLKNPVSSITNSTILNNSENSSYKMSALDVSNTLSKLGEYEERCLKYCKEKVFDTTSTVEFFKAARHLIKKWQ